MEQFPENVKDIIIGYAKTRIQPKLLVRAPLESGTTVVPSGSPTTIMSWNVMGATVEKQLRQICAIIKTHNPDVLCLQECSSELVTILSPHYFGSVSVNNSVAILSKYACNVVTYSFQRKSIKKVVVAEFKDIAVACIHLPARDTGQKARISQLNQITELTDGYNRLVVAGDFNLWDGHEDEKHIPDSWTDTDNKGAVTFDVVNNNTTKSMHPTSRSGRFDRVYVRGIQCPQVRVVASTDCPSDHYPIISQLF